jgi:hypothetical protein
VFGDGVNIARRLQELTEPDTVCISDMVYRDVAKKLDLGTVISLGRPTLKNIAERFPVYALLPKSPKGVRQTLRVQRMKLSRRGRPVHWLGVAGLALVAITAVAVAAVYSELGREAEARTEVAEVLRSLLIIQVL